MDIITNPSDSKSVRDADWRAAVLQSASSAESFDFTPLIARYTKEYGLTDNQAREHIREMCRFLSLSAHLKEGKYSIMGAVDRIWHMFIIFTKPYAEFCEIVAGRFIHHTPAQMLKSISTSKYSHFNSYNLLISDYRLAFNEEPPTHVWTQIKKGINTKEECLPDCECETCKPVPHVCDAPGPDD